MQVITEKQQETYFFLLIHNHVDLWRQDKENAAQGKKNDKELKYLFKSTRIKWRQRYLLNPIFFPPVLLKTYLRKLVAQEIRVALLHFNDLKPVMGRYGKKYR